MGRRQRSRRASTTVFGEACGAPTKERSMAAEIRTPEGAPWWCGSGAPQLLMRGLATTPAPEGTPDLVVAWPPHPGW